MINFTYHLGDNELEVEAQRDVDGDMEIMNVWLVTEKGHTPLKTDGIFIRRWKATDFTSLLDDISAHADDQELVA